MKELPACKTCINSGFLCTSCESRLEEGDLTEFELELAKNLIKKEENNSEFSFLKEVSFFKAIDYEDVVILVVGRKDKLRFTPELINWIKEMYEIEDLILIEKTKKPRPVVEALISPVKVISINEIFLATGDIQFRAVIPNSEKDKILFTKDELEDLVLELTGNITRIEFQ